MGDIKYIGGLLMVVLFAIAIVGFMFAFADDNDVAIDLEDDSGFSTLNTELGSDVEDSFIIDVNSSSSSFA